MHIPTTITQDIYAEVAKNVLGMGQHFVGHLQTQLSLMPDRWKKLSSVLAYTSSSRFNIYYFYPCLFMPAYAPLPNNVLSELSWAGRAALDYILLYDFLLDHNDLPDPMILTTSYAFQREYLLRLQSLIQNNKQVFEHLSSCEYETMQALLDEQSRRQNPLTPFSMDDYKRQAIGKAAISRLTVICLAALTGDEDEQKTRDLIAANDHYNYARQIIDDLSDWRTDYAKGHITYPLAASLISMGVVLPDDRANWPSATAVGSALYATIALPYIDIAEKNLIDAHRLVMHHGPCDRWDSIVRNYQKFALLQRATIDEVVTRARHIRINKTHLPTSIAQPPNTEAQLDASLLAASQFLLEGQLPDGCWKDYATQAGESNAWVTGYIGWALATAKLLPSVATERVSRWLEKSQLEEGGWGYTGNLVVDADSTAWSLRFFAVLPGQRVNLTKAITVLKQHQHSTGGFSTYKNPAPIRSIMRLSADSDFSGWCEPQLCVGAVALSALLELGYLSSSHEVAIGIKHLQDEQHLTGYWNSYWWHGPHYATAHALSCAAQMGAVQTEQFVRASQWLLKVQNDDGGWSAMPEIPSTAFHTALAVYGLAQTNCVTDKQRIAIRRGVQWILGQQLDDGSWRASAQLLVPSPSDRMPWCTQTWEPKLFGTGIIRQDHRRMFTAATALSALHQVARQSLV